MAPFFNPEDIVEARRDVEELMLDACIIDRPGEPVTDPDTGVVSSPHTVVYEGKCKVQQTLAQSSSKEAGGAVFTVQVSRVDIPVGEGPVQTGDRVRMVSAVSNPDLVGSTYRLSELFKKSWQTAQRLPVKEFT